MVASIVARPRQHGEERARLDSLGQPVPFVDGQIAAIAYANELILVTATVGHLAGFRNLTVENWSNPEPRRS